LTDVPSGNDPEAPAWPAAAYSARAAAAMAPRASSLCHSIRRFNWGEGKPTSEEAVTAEEIRFAKKQQWYVATACITLMAAVFTLAEKIHTNQCKRSLPRWCSPRSHFLGLLICWHWRSTLLTHDCKTTATERDGEPGSRGHWRVGMLRANGHVRPWDLQILTGPTDKVSRVPNESGSGFISRTGRQPTWKN